MSGEECRSNSVFAGYRMEFPKGIVLNPVLDIANFLRLIASRILMCGFSRFCISGLRFFKDELLA